METMVRFRWADGCDDFGNRVWILSWRWGDWMCVKDLLEHLELVGADQLWRPVYLQFKGEEPLNVPSVQAAFTEITNGPRSSRQANSGVRPNEAADESQPSRNIAQMKVRKKVRWVFDEPPSSASRFVSQARKTMHMQEVDVGGRWTKPEEALSALAKLRKSKRDHAVQLEIEGLPPVVLHSVDEAMGPLREVVRENSRIAGDGTMKLRFSKRRCLWDPVKAGDREKCEPFADLIVELHRGAQLLPLDANGLSDPYARLKLNGKCTDQRTHVVNNTLAPVWNESFMVPIHHPASTLTIEVFDSDMLVINSDDFAGWVDIDVSVLPFNQTVSAWIDLEHPNVRNFDVVEGDMDDLPQRGIAGRILVHLLLRAKQPRSEIFAYCLPHVARPNWRYVQKEGLDLSRLLNTVLALKRFGESYAKQANDLYNKYGNIVTPGSVWILALILIWIPVLAVPVLMVIACFVMLAFIKEVEHKDPAQEQNETPTVEPPSSSTLSNYLKTPLLSNRGLASASNKATASTKTVTDIQLPGGLEAMVPKAIQKDLKDIEHQVEYVLTMVKTVDAQFNEKWGRRAIAFGTVVLAIVAAFLGNLQGVVLQLGIMIGVSVALFQVSTLWHISIGIIAYFKRARRFSGDDLEDQVDQPADMDSVHWVRRLSSVCQPLPVSRVKRDRVYEMLLQYLPGRVARGRSEVLVKCNYEHADFDWVEWCDDCGSILWRLRSSKGFSCTACGRNACEKCVGLTNACCRGAVKKEQCARRKKSNAAALVSAASGLAATATARATENAHRASLAIEKAGEFLSHSLHLDGAHADNQHLSEDHVAKIDTSSEQDHQPFSARSFVKSIASTNQDHQDFPESSFVQSIQSNIEETTNPFMPSTSMKNDEAIQRFPATRGQPQYIPALSRVESLLFGSCCRNTYLGTDDSSVSLSASHLREEEHKGLPPEAWNHRGTETECIEVTFPE
eukprot:TRINITY_DN20564_c0_g1_i2.p1 TRINITY_DN20564_c0_g1~~TRINITY_DN20564_c0_g1_i2.p1  ORF type:complete len:959 (+),score=137.01 TRINITY_DN20564_c0_g1_i2:166-3042(+)